MAALLGGATSIFLRPITAEPYPLSLDLLEAASRYLGSTCTELKLLALLGMELVLS